MPPIQQTVSGDHNIFTAAGDVNVTYQLAPSEGEDRRNLLTLLDSVERFWIKDRLEGLISGGTLLALHKQTRPEMVEHPWKAVLGATDLAAREVPPDKSIADIFDGMGRLLLILGDAGSGKTTTLLELARSLVGAARLDPTRPIPVVFHLSSWADKRTAVFDWLVEELRDKYYIPRQMGRSFLKNNRLLPLLDGFDEVPSNYQSACVEAINHFAREVGVPGMVVCSRFNEYAVAQRRLKVNGAVYLEALTSEQIDDYLSAAGDGLAALRTLLREDNVLRDLAGNPLMLDVMASAYRDLPIDALRDDELNSTEARRKHVFRTYTKRMFERRSADAQPHTQGQTLLWLSWLAVNMRRNSQGIFLVERLQPSWLSGRGQLLTYILGSRVAAGSILGLAFGLPYLFALSQPLWERLAYLCCWMLNGLIIGSLAYLLKARRSAAESKQVRSQGEPPLWKLGLHVSAYSVAAGFTGSLFGGFVAWFWLALRTDLEDPGRGPYGLGGLWFALSTSAPEAPLWMKVLGFTIGCVINGLVAGLVYGIMFGLTVGVGDRKRAIDEDIQTAETISWSPARAKKAVKWVVKKAMLVGAVSGAISFLCFFLYALYMVLTPVEQGGYGRPGNLMRGIVGGTTASAVSAFYVFLVIGLITSFFFGVVGAVVGGLNTSRIGETKDLTNRGIRSSVKNSLRAGIVASVVMVLLDATGKLMRYGIDRFNPLTMTFEQVTAAEVLLTFLVWLIVYGVIAGLWYGGTDIIKHYTLRLILFYRGEAPRRFDTFLNYVVRLGFMHKVGGGYIFMHSLLRDYFAESVAPQRKI